MKPRPPDEAIRMLANYARRIESVVADLPRDVLEGLSTYDLGIVESHAQHAGAGLSNLALDCRGVSRERLDTTHALADTMIAYGSTEAPT